MIEARESIEGWSRGLHRDVSWGDYQSLREKLADRPSVRLDYDSGCMGISACTFRHGRERSLIGRVFDRLCFEMDRPSWSLGLATLEKVSVAKALKVDRCYWLEHEPAMRAKRAADLELDPPPDLAIEIESTASILNRLPIYAGIGVFEIWRWLAERIEVLMLGEDGQYHRSETSRSFPMLPIDYFDGFIRRCYDVDELSLVKEFVAWVRDGMPPLE